MGSLIAQNIIISFNRALETLRTLDVQQLPYITVTNSDCYGQLPPSLACVYFLIGTGRKPVRYVGKAINLRSRWNPGSRLGASVFLVHINV